MSEVPFANHHCLIATGFRYFGDGDLVRIKTDTVLWEEDTWHTDAGAVAARHEAGAGHRTDGCGVEVGEAHALFCETV